MKITSTKISADGTKKFLIELEDGLQVEAVLIFHKRTVCACLSSQVGCAMGCGFCATGKMGLKRNLTAEEIIGQYDLLDAQHRITNIVFMGMGEPLHNYDALVGALRELKKREFPWKKITVSTVGIPEKIRQLGKDVQCRLAVSIHASNDELRSRLVPVNKRFNLGDILKACKEFPSHHKNPIMIEYVLLKGVNDSLEHAAELCELLKALPFVMVNLIPYNTVQGLEFEEPSENTCLQFKQKLIDAGYKTIIRTTKGRDAQAACGMLIVKH